MCGAADANQACVGTRLRCVYRKADQTCNHSKQNNVAMQTGTSDHADQDVWSHKTGRWSHRPGTRESRQTETV